jgi:hypothetical protein
MTNSRIKLDLLPEQKRYLEHLIKEMMVCYSLYQGASKGSERAQKWWDEYRKFEDLLKSEFGLENL